MEDALSINWKTRYRKRGKSLINRYALKNNDCYKFCSIIQKQKRCIKMTPLLITYFHNWIINHEHVKRYSYRNDCTNYFFGCDKRISVIKLYLQVTIKYSYYDITKLPSLGVLDEAIDSDKTTIIV